ncbi:AAA family ATPase [Lancefieldella rimae]|uniref:AAA family ATPase n=1 Tax=Lancefieldella rimae TaxID=1383 RepID=UPI0028E82172|nr:AAA family ATPase [Lancefieldella rimae]
MKKQHRDLLDALDAIDPAGLSYQEWVDCGMALHESGFTWQDWDEWSRQDSARYHEGECERKWKSFGNGVERVTSGTIIQMARERGWYPSQGPVRAIDWDEPIMVGGITPDWVDEEDVDINGGTWHPARELSDYLQTLFDDSDHVCYVNETYEKDGRYMPKRGHWGRTAEQLREELSKCKNDDIGAVLGDWNENAGAWICFNPMDGKGRGNQNVTEYRYALVESDTLEVEKQLGMIKAMKLPCAAVVSSGHKSVHAIVRIDAGSDYALYRKRVEKLYQYCATHGFSPDTANKNPSRLSRMPGITRAGNRQKLLELNIGCKDWDEWEVWIDESEDDLPDEVDCSDWDEPVVLNAPLIGTEDAGLLRQGQKLIVTGDSKMGKSYALIDLAEAVCTGGDWLDMPCAKGKVLYVNLEIEADEFRQRLHTVWNARRDHADAEKVNSLRQNFYTWNLRGKARLMKELTPLLIRRVLKHGESGTFAMIIVDPVYKVNGGDDNDSRMVTEFTNAIDRITEECGCAVVYAHHHPKGTSGQKKAMDRMSGSGVYARDADSMCDFTPLEIPEEFRKTHLSGAPAYRVSMTTRSFPTPPEKNVIFSWPRFYLDPTGKLSRFETEGADPFAKGRESKLEKNRKIRKEASELMQKAFDKALVDGCGGENNLVPLNDLMDRIGTKIDAEGCETKPTTRNVRNWANSDWCPIGKKQIETEGSRGRTKKITVFYDTMKEAEEDFWSDSDT